MAREPKKPSSKPKPKNLPATPPKGDDSKYVFELPEDPTEAQEQEYRRNMMVVDMKRRGWSWPAVTEKSGVPERTGRRILDAYRAAYPSLTKSEPTELVDFMADNYHTLVEDFQRAADNADNSAALVGALNGKRGALGDLLVLMQATGVLPRDLGRLTMLIDGRQTAEKIIAVLDRHSISPEVQREIREALEGPRLPHDAESTAEDV